MIKETIISAQKTTSKVEKKVDNKKDEKSLKTVQEIDREKLESKFSKTKKGTLN